MYGDTCGEFVTMYISGALSVKMSKNTTTEKGEWISEVHRARVFTFH